jgi:hypothetical protein
MAVVTVHRSGRAPFARWRGRARNGRLASRRANITTAVRAKRFGKDCVSRATRRPHHKKGEAKQLTDGAEDDDSKLFTLLPSAQA